MFYFYFLPFGFVCLSQQNKPTTIITTTATTVFVAFPLHTSATRSEHTKQCQEAYFTHLFAVCIYCLLSSFLYSVLFFFLPFSLFAMTHKIDTILPYVIKCVVPLCHTGCVACMCRRYHFRFRRDINEWNLE